MILLYKYCKNFAGAVLLTTNVAEQLSVLETSRDITGVTLQSYLPEGSNLPSVIKTKKRKRDFSTERDIL
jgi:hypothetical protein